MKKILITAVIAGAFATVVGYKFGLYQIPIKAMEMAEGKLAQRAGGVNIMLHPARPTADARTIVRPSPDQLYSACVYDLSHGPVRFTGETPKNSYWSLSFFAHNTDNFFVQNDGHLKTNNFDYLLVYRDGPTNSVGAKTKIITSPSKTGIVVQRVFIAQDDRAGELDAVRKKAKCFVNDQAHDVSTNGNIN